MSCSGTVLPFYINQRRLYLFRLRNVRTYSVRIIETRSELFQKTKQALCPVACFFRAGVNYACADHCKACLNPLILSMCFRCLLQASTGQQSNMYSWLATGQVKLLVTRDRIRREKNTYLTAYRNIPESYCSEALTGLVKLRTVSSFSWCLHLFWAMI
jgi:hypothetical protein